MGDTKEIDRPASAELDLGRWLGRREAFSLIAARCSAAEAETLRRIRDDKLYLACAPNWDEFCERELGASRRNINRVIGYLKEFGPQYFHVVQMTRITPQEYRAIAAHVDQAGVRLDSEVVALLPENQQRVAGAVNELLRRSRPAPPLKEAPDFADAPKRCESAAEVLESVDDSTNDADRKKLLGALMRLRRAGLRFGVIFDR